MPKRDTAKERSILKALIAGEEPKNIAFLNECSINLVYDLRREYFVERWVLKRHPKGTFKLES